MAIMTNSIYKYLYLEIQQKRDQIYFGLKKKNKKKHFASVRDTGDSIQGTYKGLKK